MIETERTMLVKEVCETRKEMRALAIEVDARMKHLEKVCELVHDALRTCDGNLTEVLANTIVYMGFTQKAMNVLNRNRIFTLAELVRLSESRLLAMNGMGERTAREITGRMRELGLWFGMLP